MKKILLGLTVIVASAAVSAHAATISVNLTMAGAPSETGFTSWESADNNNSVANLLLTLGTDNLTISAPASGINDGSIGTLPNPLRSVNRGGNDGYAGTLASMSQTWWGQRASSTGPGGFITINISGLSAGSYSFTSFHLDHEDQTGGMIVDFSDDGGSSFTEGVVPSFDLLNFAGGGSGNTPGDGATAPYEATFSFVSTGADVQIRFRNNAATTSSTAFALTNGFQLTQIPEPSAALLGGLGLLALLRRRR